MGRFGSKTSRRTSKPPRMAAFLFDALKPRLACCAQGGVLLEPLSEILLVGTVLLRDAAYGLIPRDHPRNNQGKCQPCGQRSQGSLAKIAPVQPKGKINFEGEHAQQRNGRINKSENDKNLGEAAGDISPQSTRASAQHAVRYGIADHLPER